MRERERVLEGDRERKSEREERERERQRAREASHLKVYSKKMKIQNHHEKVILTRRH